jgi:hypothetical protein
MPLMHTELSVMFDARSLSALLMGFLSSAIPPSKYQPSHNILCRDILSASCRRSSDLKYVQLGTKQHLEETSSEFLEDLEQLSLNRVQTFYFL